MASAAKSDHLHLNYSSQLNINQSKSGSSTGNTSPIESAPNSLRPSFGHANGLGAAGSASSAVRLGAGSPSQDLGGGRLFSRRAREIQAQERLTPSVWGPPTSGNSTPLRENIPESPTDGFPDLVPLPSQVSSASAARRTRAGTVPSRFAPGGIIEGVAPQQHPLLPKTAMPTPTRSPFKSGSPVNPEIADAGAASAVTNSALLSRLRSGSVPQRHSYVGPTGPFGPTLFSSNWSSNRERASTLASVASVSSTNGPSSPSQSNFSKDGLGDNEMRTLDYLGLADTPQQPRARLAAPGMETLIEGQHAAAMQPFFADLVGLNKNLNRFRSYSVNAKEKYAADEDEELGLGPYSGTHSGTMTPSAAHAAAALAATQAQIHQHNLAVQAFANQASASRPRARTAGVLESPNQRSMRSYLATPSRLDNSITAADLGLLDVNEYEGLPEAVRAMQLGGFNPRPNHDAEGGQEGPTRALWLGSIPSSTTVTSLNAIFSPYGVIESARVLTHKNCGFVNFEHIDSAIQARSILNGKEIFPGAGPTRIGYAKAPDSSAADTPGANGAVNSPSPDPHATGQGVSNGVSLRDRDSTNPTGHTDVLSLNRSASVPAVSSLVDLRPEMLQIVKEFGASDEDQMRIAASIEQAINFDAYQPEIPNIPEPSQGRIHDAPKLREIRKRIDNNSCSQAEIEEIAIGMLPEIAELASDYLGNTVVQKLFEHCSEEVKESMLREIAPHLAEIGVHKNGTWAAQKIIDVSKTASQMSAIVESLRPYATSLFLDQYGNYVLQCVLRFGAPWNNFIFETMLDRIWDVAQGRFGARAMRACLESHHSTKDQQRMLASAITLHSVQLATNTNGALLLTWLLDTCTFPQRRTVLAPRLVPHLVHLCTHKVAYLTVLKVINQKNEPEARDIVQQALFFSENDQVLEAILGDAGCGATLIFKVLTTPFFEESLRTTVVQNIRNVLLRLKAQPAQGYKRLMDEVGLPTRGSVSGASNREPRDNSIGRSPSRDRQKIGARHHGSNGHTPQPVMERPHGGQYFQHAQQLPYDQGMAGSGANDPNGMTTFDQYALGPMNGQVYAPHPNLPVSPIGPQHLQYQSALLAASGRSAVPPNAFYQTMNGGLSGYPSPAPTMDNYRVSNMPQGGNRQVSPSPMLAQSGFASPFTPMMNPGQMMGNGMGYPGMNPMQFVPPQQQQPINRRGRR